MKAGLVVGLVEPAQRPDNIHRLIRGKVPVPGIGCAGVKFLLDFDSSYLDELYIGSQFSKVLRHLYNREKTLHEYAILL